MKSQKIKLYDIYAIATQDILIKQKLEQFTLFIPLCGLISVNCPNPCYIPITSITIEFIP